LKKITKHFNKSV